MRESKRPEERKYITVLAQGKKCDFLGTMDLTTSVTSGCLGLWETVKAWRRLLWTYLVRGQLLLCLIWRSCTWVICIRKNARQNLKWSPCWVSVAWCILPYNITFWRQSSSVCSSSSSYVQSWNATERWKQFKEPLLASGCPWATSHMWMHLCKSALSELVNPGSCGSRAWFLYFADLQWRYHMYFPIPRISARDSCMARKSLQGRAAPSFSPALRGPPLAPAARSALGSVWLLLEQL